MIRSNEDVTRILNEIAFFLRLQGAAHPLKAKRFQRAASTVAMWPREVIATIRRCGLTELPHIDRLVDPVIAEILTAGRSTLHQEVCGTYPLSLAELQDIPGLTHKQIFLLYRHAGVRSLADLRCAVRNPQHLLSLPSFGKHNVPRLCTTVQTMAPTIAGIKCGIRHNTDVSHETGLEARPRL